MKLSGNPWIQDLGNMVDACIAVEFSPEVVERYELKAPLVYVTYEVNAEGVVSETPIAYLLCDEGFPLHDVSYTDDELATIHAYLSEHDVYAQVRDTVRGRY